MATVEPLDTLYGTIRIPDWLDDLIVRSLRQLGEWCAAETILAASILESEEVLWDGGAFLGTFSLGVAAQSRPAHVVAIEPNPTITQALTQNLEWLPCESHLVQAGLAARPGWLATIAQDPDNYGATTYRHTEEEPTEGPAVRCCTLPDLRREYGDYDFLKLDIEGLEFEALQADFPYLNKRRPILWAECNENTDSLQLLRALKWLKYEVLYVAFPAFRRDNFRGSADLIYPMAYEAALVAGPANRLARLTNNSAALLPSEDIICRPIASAFDLRLALFDTPRWSRREWTQMSRAELIARLGRCGRGTRLEGFLLGVESTDH